MCEHARPGGKADGRSVLEGDSKTQRGWPCKGEVKTSHPPPANANDTCRMSKRHLCVRTLSH